MNTEPKPEGKPEIIARWQRILGNKSAHPTARRMATEAVIALTQGREAAARHRRGEDIQKPPMVERAPGEDTEEPA